MQQNRGNRFKFNDVYINELIEKNILVHPIEEYKGTNEKILHECLVCGYEYYASPHNILRGKEKCKNCKLINIDRNFKQKVYAINPTIKILNMYRGCSNNRIKVRCLNCNSEWKTTASALYKYRECQYCGHVTNTVEEEDFLNRLNKINPDIKLISKYKKIGQRHLFECRKCGHVWNMLGTSLRKETIHCSICNPQKDSKGEVAISKFLDKYNINYEKNKTYKGLIGLKGGLLSYDFYLPQYNLLIEFNGVQHEKFTPGLQSTYDNFETQLIHDNLKTKYAQNNNIELLIIWYYDYENIDDILMKKLKLESVETAGCA